MSRNLSAVNFVASYQPRDSGDGVFMKRRLSDCDVHVLDAFNGFAIERSCGTALTRVL